MTDAPREPRTDRPYNPAGGYWTPRPLPWSWARVRLERARNYWVSSTLPSGAPLSRPVWAIWLDERLIFSTGSRTGSNLERDPRVTVHLDSGDEVVILEGVASRVSERAGLERFVEVYNAKYGEWFDVDSVVTMGALLAVTPRVAFGWLSDPTGDDRGAAFGSTGTRWTFEA